jgi:hypothetical protein
MAFEIAPETDPLTIAVTRALSEITGVQSNLISEVDRLRQLTIDATNYTAQNVNRGFGSVTDIVTGQMQTWFGSVGDAAENALLETRAEIEALGTAFDVGVKNVVLQNQAQLDAAILQLTAQSEEVAEETKSFWGEALQVLETAGKNSQDSILGIPGFIHGLLTDPLGEIKEGLDEVDGLLGGTMGALTPVLGLGFSSLVDRIGTIFAIDPGDFQAGVELVMPAMKEFAERAGNEILEAD